MADRGFEVPTIVVTPAELVAIAEDAARIAREYDDVARHYVSLLKAEPTAAAVATIEALSDDGEIARVSGRGVHLLHRTTMYHQARLTNVVTERHLGVATNRNLTVISALATRWGPG